MRIVCLPLVVTIFAIAILGATASGQTAETAVSAQPDPTPSPSLEKKFLAHILQDQRAIWTAPLSLRRADGKWLVPLGVATALFIATDRHTSGALLERPHPTRVKISGNVSRFGTAYATGGVAFGFYLVGKMKHSARAQETGVLGGEALIDSIIVVMALKGVSQRERPRMDNTNGEFLVGGLAFPSGHAIAAWSIATVVAKEYGQGHPLVSISAYGLAAAVSVARYTGTNHFLSDVLVGSALGYGIGRYVYHEHHDRSLDRDNQTNKRPSITQSKFFPRITPSYNRRNHIYGATLSWGL
jgi:membrane-associated phospholipid phosphatase